MTSGGFAPLADLLAEDHTVVTMTHMGLVSTVDDPTLAVTPGCRRSAYHRRARRHEATCSAAWWRVAGSPLPRANPMGGHPHRARAARGRPAA